MRKLLVLVSVFVSLAAYSQGLTPRMYGNGTDTVFAFSRLQMKGVTKLIVKGQFDAQTIKKQEHIISEQEKKLQSTGQLVRNLYAEIAINEQKIAQRDTALTQADSVIRTQNRQLTDSQTRLEHASRTNRRTRRVAAVLIVLSLILGTQL